MGNEFEKKKKEFIKKLNREIETKSPKKLTDILLDIEKEFQKEGVLTDDIRNILVAVRSRLGVPQYIGVKGEYKGEEKVLEVDIINILTKSGGIISVKELLKNLIKMGWAISDFALEKTLAKMAKKKIITVKKGLISKGPIIETNIGKKIVELIMERKNLKVSDVASEVNIGDDILREVLEELAKNGLIVMKGDQIYLID